MKIVIFGLAKSGTTALFYKIKNSLSPDTVCLFEPTSFDPRGLKGKAPGWLRSRRREPNVLAKVLPFRPHQNIETGSFAQFERQILIVRDPRDRIISRFLYGVFDSNFFGHDDPVNRLLDLLRKKELDPNSVTLRTLLETFAELDEQSFSFDRWKTLQQDYSIRRPLSFHEARPGLFVFKYEDLVEERFQGLEEYLGITLSGEAAVPGDLSRVTRTRNYGNWRDWFTKEDVESLRPLVQPFLDRYYREADWKLSAAPSIPADHCSGYVKRIVNDRRVRMKLPPLV